MVRGACLHAPPAAAASSAGQAADDDVEEGNDGVDDGPEDTGDGVNDRHDAVANRPKDGLDAGYYGTHCCAVVRLWFWMGLFCRCLERCSFAC